MAKKQVDKYKARPDGRYFTQVNTGRYTDEGKPIRIPLYAKTSKELEKLVNETKYEIEHGTFACDKGITFGEYATKWLEIHKATKGIRTKSMYSNILKNHIGVIEFRKLKDLTKSDIQMQINACLDKPRICQLIRLTVSQILDCAMDDGLINKNPCKNLQLPRRVVKQKRALTSAEKKAIKKADFDAEQRAFIYILYGCGLRPGELYALTKNDINFRTNEITINKTLVFDKTKPIVTYPKTNSGIRTIPAPNFVFEAIKAWMDVNHNIILFCDDYGNYRTRSAYYNVFDCALRKIHAAMSAKGKIRENETSSLSQYTFRHNYCTELYYSGISLKEAQRLMGHADYSMIMKVYSHLDEKKENTRDKINKMSL